MLSSIQEVIDAKWEETGTSKNKLVEKGISNVQISSTTGPYLLYKFEKDGEIQMPYLSCVKNVRKISDYVLFTTKKDTLFVLIFELKNGNACPREQLKATEILSRYFIETAKRVSKKKFKKVEYRRIGITNNAVKRTLRPSKIYDKHRYTQLTGTKSTGTKPIDIKSLYQ